MAIAIAIRLVNRAAALPTRPANASDKTRSFEFNHRTDNLGRRRGQNATAGTEALERIWTWEDVRNLTKASQGAHAAMPS